MVGVVSVKFDVVFGIGEEIKIEFKISVFYIIFYVYWKVGLFFVKVKIVVVVDSREIEKEFFVEEVILVEGGCGVVVGKVEEEVMYIVLVS